MNFRERLESLTRLLFLIFILASAAFLSAITAIRIAIHGREVAMPNLVGKNVSEANKLLQSSGLVLNVADRIYTDQPINVVVRQTPSPGLLMKVSQQAHVVLSLGQRQLQIPVLEGSTLRVSRIELLRTGLQIGEVTEFAFPDQPAEFVVLQYPRPGAGAATPRVDVLVSSGPRKTFYVMPHVVGLSEPDALRQLDPAKLPHKTNYVAAPQWPRGSVIDQAPMSGAKISDQSTIELTVAN
jgi:beta-lactam-binding protein with PASTA domain